MRAVDLGGVEVGAQGSPWALFVYQREFSTPTKPCSWYADYDAARSGFEPSGDAESDAMRAVAAMDPVFCLKTLWACAKAIDPSMPGFEPWLEGLKDSAEVPMHPFAPWKLEVLALVNAEIFRYDAKGQG